MGPLVSASLWWMGASPGLAQPPTVGLFVGSNRPGAGQAALQYAVADAERFREVLRELGGLTDDLGVLVDPDAATLREALEVAEERLRALQEAGEPSVFVFYYSGHARSQALSLGASELALPTLREALEAMPSTVTLAVLDACQSGAISGVKGVEPAPAFSYNSTDLLQAEGLAVMASSTGTELSQESGELQGSFFTHHLVTGLRGPADADRDGAVSLDEAYDYAYRRTLATTAPTRVGGQHATLETKLRGRGEMVLTRPQQGTAWLELDGPPGRILVVRKDNGAVVAEIVRSEGPPLTVALPAADYELVGHDDDGGYTCALELAEGASMRMSAASCARVARTAVLTPKSAAATRRAYVEPRFGLELAGGLLASPSEDGYLDRLREFGFVDASPTTTLAELSPVGTVSVTARLRRRWIAGLTASTLEWGQLARDWRAAQEEDTLHTMTWRGWRAGLFVRYTAPLAADRLLVSLQGGGGLALASADLSGSVWYHREQTSSGHLAAATALHWMVGPRLGLVLQGEAVHAPALRTLQSDRRNVGGASLTLGLRIHP